MLLIRHMGLDLGIEHLDQTLHPRENFEPKKGRPFFYFYFFSNWDFDLEISHLRKKVFILTSKM